MVAKKMNRLGFNLGDAREAKALKAVVLAEGSAAGDDATDPDFEELQTLSAAQQAAVDEQLEREMRQEVVSDDDLRDACATDAQRKRKVPDPPPDQPVAVRLRKNASAQKSKATSKSLAVSAQLSNLSMFFRDSSKKEAREETPAIAQATPAVMTDGTAVVVGVRVEGGTADAECATPKPPTLTRHGKRVGRPPKAEAQGSCSTATAYASHGGSRPSATGNATTSKATRRNFRQFREGGGAGEVAAMEAAAAELAAEAAAEAAAKKPRKERGPKLLPYFVRDHPELCAALKRIDTNLHFDRYDFEGGEQMHKVEWLQLQAEPHELRRARAMSHFVTLQELGWGVEVALEEVCRGVLIGAKQKTLATQTLREWLQLYVKKGRLVHSQVGFNVSTETFLADQDLKDRALQWLRSNCRAGQAKGSVVPMLRPKHFCDWVNSELLKDILAADPKRKGIHEKTAQNWMHALGFGYESHKKGMYFDGHERRDVQIDRDEKMVMLQARNLPYYHLRIAILAILGLPYLHITCHYLPAHPGVEGGSCDIRRRRLRDCHLAVRVAAGRATIGSRIAGTSPPTPHNPPLPAPPLWPSSLQPFSMCCAVTLRMSARSTATTTFRTSGASPGRCP